jgi:ABC-2 type transport system ATP-binding protein
MSLTATHLIVVGQGRLIADASVAELTAASGGSVVRVRTDEAPRLRDLLVADGVSVTSTERDLLTVTGLSSAEIGQVAVEARIALVELTPQQASLEEAFMELTRDAVEFGTPMEGAAR